MMDGSPDDPKESQTADGKTKQRSADCCCSTGNTWPQDVVVLVFGGPTDVNRQLGEQEDEEMVPKSS